MNHIQTKLCMIESNVIPTSLLLLFYYSMLPVKTHLINNPNKMKGKRKETKQVGGTCSKCYP